MSLVCKLFNVILTAFNMAADGVAYALNGAGEAIVPILGSLGEIVSDTVGGIFGGGGGFLFTVGLLGVVFLLNRDKREKSVTSMDVSETMGGTENV